jgi:hypothetical protein
MLVLILTSACGNELDPPTRTPVPTWTPTPLGGDVQPAVEENQQPPTQQAQPQEAAPPPTDPPTPEPPSPTPAATDTPAPTATPAATDTPTALPTLPPTPTPEYVFELEIAEKLPTDSLAPDVVRIYLYVYSPSAMGLAGYSLQVLHNGAPLIVDEVSTAGVPDVTRTEPGPYTRFTNLNVIFVEPQAGRWDIQLIDEERRPVGPPVSFDLTADEATRELYVRYRQLS